MLVPLLADSPRWRAVWLELAPWQKDLESAAACIERAAPLIPENSSDEQWTLANAWYAVGVKFESASALGSAAKILRTLTSLANEIPQAWVLTAMNARAQCDYETAEKAYRHVLSKNPNSADCLNNVAYILWLRGGASDLPEARRMAEAAIAMRPGDASFYDTLARIQAKSGEVHLARETFRMALQKDPNSIDALIGQADLLSRDPAACEEARGLIDRIQRLLDGAPPPSSVLIKQYQSARELLARSQ